MRRIKDIRRKVNISGRSLTATIPSEVVDYLDVKYGDQLSWSTKIMNGNKVAVVRIPGD